MAPFVLLVKKVKVAFLFNNQYKIGIHNDELQGKKEGKAKIQIWNLGILKRKKIWNIEFKITIYQSRNGILRSDSTCLDFPSSFIISNNNSTWCNNTLY
jgi:hypothetical protein